jgi:Cu(I)/Ag(I) efflux system membrane fusion protein
MTKRAAVGLMLAVLAVAAWLYLRPFDLELPAGVTGGTGETYPAGPFAVELTLTPRQPRVGKNRLRVAVRDQQGRAVGDVRLQAVAEMPAMGAMPAMQAPVDFKALGPGAYEGGFELSMAGAWPLTLALESASKGTASLSFEMSTSRAGLRLPGTAGAGPSTLREGEAVAGTVVVDARRRQLIGVTTAKAGRRRLVQTLRAAGRVSYDETRLTDVTLKFDGWIETLYANAVGAPVRRGEALFTVYAPALVSAQEEYLESLRRRQRRDDAMVAAARQRLLLWDIAPAQITALERRGRAAEALPILAPATGTVIEKNIVKGSAAAAGQKLLRIADLSKVWVEGQVYEYEIPLVSVGMPVEVVLPDIAGRTFESQLSYVYPYLEGDSRTARVRVELDNPAGLLRPQMYAQLRLHADLGERLMVPEAAVVYAGDTRVVFVDLGDGRLEPRRIETGLRNAEHIEILEGLGEDELVVTSANFLIAAESKLKAGIAQW